MSTPNDRDAAAADQDPTGMRALLASLPDPGPMPAQVAERITASLQAEQQHRLHHPGPEGMPSAGPERTRHEVTPTTAVSSLESRRRTRVPHLLAAVASVAAVAIAGVVLLDQVAGEGSLGEMTALYWTGNDTVSSGEDAAGSAGGSVEGGSGEGGSGDSGSEDSGSGDGAAEGEADALQEAGEAAQAEPLPGSVAGAAPDAGASPTERSGTGTAPGDVRVLAVTRPLTSETFALGVSVALDTAADRAAAAAEESELSAPAAASCLRTTGESPAAHRWTVSAITLDGNDAVLVVATGQPDRAWALTPDCALDTEGSEVLLGPVDVP